MAIELLVELLAPEVEAEFARLVGLEKDMRGLKVARCWFEPNRLAGGLLLAAGGGDSLG